MSSVQIIVVTIICFVGLPIDRALAQGKYRCIVIELYHDGDSAESDGAKAAISRLTSNRRGVIVVHRNTQQEHNLRRLQAIAKFYRVSEDKLPLAYGGNRIAIWKGAQPFRDRCREMLDMEVFVRRGCPKCARARTYLAEFASRYPAVRIHYRDLVTERNAASDLNALVRKHRKAAASVPVFHAGNQLLIGFDRPETTGRRLEKLFERWTTPCPIEKAREDRAPEPRDTSHLIDRWNAEIKAHAVRGSFKAILFGFAETSEETVELPLPSLDSQDSALPLPEDDYVPVPSEQDDESGGIVDLPWFGQLNVRRVGLPILTLAIGLVDGFNPCAMWVLLFLLSLLVNLRDRGRILAVAACFVFVSGLAYFAFMAAWLNVFLLIGLLRPVQILLGLLGIAVGLIHVKDFFAFKKGVSLSIPESAKPGIYARTRSIITAENLMGAILGAVTLAVLVNIVELLCTAGLPALYTEILASYNLPLWQNYAYLALYILAYMFDDSLMVAIVVITLNKQRLQETQGRWLKLVSGTVITALGFVVLLQPDWLM